MKKSVIYVVKRHNFNIFKGYFADVPEDLMERHLEMSSLFLSAVDGE